MMAETIRKVSASLKNILGRSWEPVWIQYHDGVNIAPPLYFSANSLIYRQEIPEGKGLSYTNSRSPLDREKFSKWDTDGTQPARIRNVNARFMFNRTEEDVNSFRRIF